VEFLKERALQFLEMSKAAAERGFYELALFHAEQALQLYTKYLIYKLGDSPKTRFPLDLLDKVLEPHGAVCNRQLPPTPFCCIGVVGTRVYNLSLPPL